MHRALVLTLAWLAAPVPDARPEGAPEGLAERAWAVMDAVLDHHVSPPARQQMMLDGFEAAYRAAGMPAPSGLARRVSAVTTAEQFRALLDEVWDACPEPNTTSNEADQGRTVPDIPRRSNDAFRTQVRGTQQRNVAGSDRQAALINGLLASVAGGARLVSAKEWKVQQQIAGNHYVGLQIALGFNADLKRPEIVDVLKGGPADRAGVVRGDVIEEVDGVTTNGLELYAVIDRLRGAEGTDVTIRVRQGKAAPRTYTVTRGMLPRKTIEGIQSFGGASGDKLVDDPGLISYLKFSEIAGSTPHELRQLARTLDDEGAKALVLDLRNLSRVEMHAAVLLADELLDGGTIGRVRMANRVAVYTAEPDALFRDRPLAVLVDTGTTGAAEWFAAALQDNHRAVIIGRSPVAMRAPGVEGLGALETAVPFGDGSQSIVMMAGLFERGDGRPLSGRPSTVQPPRRMGTQTAATTNDGGLVPDVVIPTAPRAQPPDARRRGAPARDANTASDPFLTAALRRMRAALKLPPLGPKGAALDRVTVRDEVPR